MKELLRLNINLKRLVVVGNHDIDESVEMCERRKRADEGGQEIVYY